MYKLYVAVDVGCIDCGEKTSVMGVFTEFNKAQKVCDEHEERQRNNWHGKHSFEVHEVYDIDQLVRVEYDD